MKICLITAFPPSGRQLNEYGLYLARELQRNPLINLTILADKLTYYEWNTDANGLPIHNPSQQEMPGFDVIRCWESNRVASPLRLIKAVHDAKPDVVWFNLVYSTFGTPEFPVAAFAGLCAPAVTRAMGYFTHVTLHHIVEHVDFHDAGVKRERLYRFGSALATRVLLNATSVSVLLSGYRRTLAKKYSVDNVLLGTHGIFARCPTPPDFSVRGNPDQRLLAIGHWGTYKRLETLMEAFPAVLRRVPTARLIIAGSNHHTKPGYWESVREKYGPNPRIEFRGYVKEEGLPELFSTASILILPYDSATGSSGPAHQACEYGLPIVSADLSDFRDMAADEDMAVSFYKTGDPVDLAAQLIGLLESPQDQRMAAEQNYAAAVRMTMPHVVRHYLRWFELERRRRSFGSSAENRIPLMSRRRASLRAALHALPPAARMAFSTDDEIQDPAPAISPSQTRDAA